MAFSLFRSRLFDLVDEFNDPFFQSDPFFARRPVTMPLLVSMDDGTPEATQGKSVEAPRQVPTRREEKRVTKPAESKELRTNPFGWVNREFSAATDISESKTHWTVAMDLPGIKPENVKIEIQNGMLTVQGSRQNERNEESDKDGVKWRVVERSSGSFARSIAVPRDVDQEKISANQENGVLRITLPKLPAATKSAEPKMIPIGTSTSAPSVPVTSPRAKEATTQAKQVTAQAKEATAAAAAPASASVN